jgi:hypothetical protein
LHSSEPYFPKFVAKLGDQTMQVELLEPEIKILEDGLRPPQRRPSP